MLTQTAAVAVTMASGVVAGVFFAVAISVLPTLFALPMGQYIQTHRLLGEGYHPVMPVTVFTATLIDAALAVVAPTAATRVLYIVAAVAFCGVQGVSHLCNVPINRVVHAVDLSNLPDDWRDPRPQWRTFHMIRTACAFTVLTCNAVAAVLVA